MSGAGSLLLRRQADAAFEEFMASIEGVDEAISRLSLPHNTDDYLHSDGTIYGIVLHVAVCKKMYGSVAFRSSEIRWRDCEAELRAFEPEWQPALDYLRGAHAYWLECWRDLNDGDLEKEVKHFRGRMIPCWRLIDIIIRHDAYHAGQIAAVRYAGVQTGLIPASSADDIALHCRELPDY